METIHGHSEKGQNEAFPLRLFKNNFEHFNFYCCSNKHLIVILILV